MTGQELCVGPVERPDKYRLVRLEGSGGEASLWRAEVDLAGLAEHVAVKVLRPEHGGDLARISARWAEQAELLRFVTHPSVVGVREHFEGAPPHPAAEGTGGVGTAGVGSALYLVMNWVPGLPLRDWLLLHQGREGTVRGLRLLEQVADALEMLHTGRVTPSGRPVVHGDLSPGNVMVTDEGQAVLVDFGLVRLASHRTLAAAGTPGFAAPEVWSRGEYTPAADRYSFAALGFYCLLGAPPPAGEAEIADALLRHPFLADTPSGSAERILDGFSVDPARRPGVVEWLRVLRGAASTAARTTSAGTTSSRATSAGTTSSPTAEAGDAAGAGRTRDRPAARSTRRRDVTAVVGDGTDCLGVDAADDVEAQLAGCWSGPGELVWSALLTRRWAVIRTWWTRRGGASYHVKLRDRSGDWIVVEMELRGQGASSRLVWASGAGGAMTECPTELAQWFASA